MLQIFPDFPAFAGFHRSGAPKKNGINRFYLRLRRHSENRFIFRSGIDFGFKDNYFLPAWISLLLELGFYSLGKRERIWYGSDFGRHGRKKLAHELIMTIRHGGTELTNAICNAFPSGVRRYVTDKQALRFLNYSRPPLVAAVPHY